MRVRAKQSVKIGGTLRVPSKPSGTFEWDPKWGDPAKLVRAGLISLEGGASDAAASTQPPTPRFSSASAEERAKEAGLTLEDFEGRTPSGQRGFTVADVEGFVAQLEAIEERRAGAAEKGAGAPGGPEGDRAEGGKGGAGADTGADTIL